MKLLSFLQDGSVKPGVVQGEEAYDLSAVCDSILDLLNMHGGDLSVVQAAIDGNKLASAGRLDSLHFRPPVCYPRKLLCVAGNYVAHIEEGGRKIQPMHTQAPWLFCVPPTTVMIGHREQIQLPPKYRKIDYEGELAVVIGRTAKGVSAEDAHGYIAGYTIYNDVSERTPYMTEHVEQMNRVSFWYTKSFDTFGPTGPWLVTQDEVPDPQDLTISVKVNGEQRQNCHTGKMIFSVYQLVEFLSSFLTLEPGDVVSTGTPAGVGSATGQFLEPDDTVEISIDGVGTLENQAVLS